MAQKFRKKPVVIEAAKWEGTSDSYENIRDIGCNAPHPGSFNNPLKIATLEGTMRAEIGDWIIKGVKGEFYPCKNDVFDATYEPVTD